MSDEKESQPGLSPSSLDPIKEKTLFDAFAAQAAKTATWSDAVKAQLPRKPD